MNTHPNATASAASGSVGALAIAAAQHFGVNLDPAVAAAAVGVLTTVVLLIGRDGVKGLAKIVWRGSTDAMTAAAEAPAPAPADPTTPAA